MKEIVFVIKCMCGGGAERVISLWYVISTKEVLLKKHCFLQTMRSYIEI